MKIAYNYSTIKKFANMLFAHDFDAHEKIFQFNKFLEPALNESIEDAFLTKLSISNPQGIACFEDFWIWVQKNYGEELSQQFCEYNFSDKSQAHKHIFVMIENHKHIDWNHIKARAYKVWYSVLTQAQCSYAVLRGIDKAQKNWSVISSPELSSYGIDLAILTDTQAVPININKHIYANDKKEHIENLSRFKLGSRTLSVFKKNTARYVQKPADLLILNYEAKKIMGENISYDYLQASRNNFIFFDGEKTLACVEKAI